MYTALARRFHYEFKPLGVYVTVLAAGFTNTAVLRKVRPRSEDHAVETDERRAVVSEALSGLAQKPLKNRSRPAEPHLERPRARFSARKMEADLLVKGLRASAASAGPSSSLVGSTGS